MGGAIRKISFGILETVLINGAEVYGCTGVNIPSVSKAVRWSNYHGGTKSGMIAKERIVRPFLGKIVVPSAVLVNQEWISELYAWHPGSGRRMVNDFL